MDPAAIVNDLSTHGVTLELRDGTGLRARGVLTDRLRCSIRENRTALLAHLRREDKPTPAAALTLEKVLEIFPAAGPVEWQPNAVAEKARAKL
jgi:hypothetical protein